jgi:colicin import membrane protein
VEADAGSTAAPSAGEEGSIHEPAEREALARLVGAERPTGASEALDEERIDAETERLIAEAAEREGSPPPHVQTAAESDRGLARQMEETEARIAAAQQRTADALDRAAARLAEAEARASEAESRAAHAEELAKLKGEEMESEVRLRELLDRIAEAERRADEAEQRARETVARMADPADPQGAEPAADPPEEPRSG